MQNIAFMGLFPLKERKAIVHLHTSMHWMNFWHWERYRKKAMCILTFLSSLYSFVTIFFCRCNTDPEVYLSGHTTLCYGSLRLAGQTHLGQEVQGCETLKQQQVLKLTWVTFLPTSHFRIKCHFDSGSGGFQMSSTNDAIVSYNIQSLEFSSISTSKFPVYTWNFPLKSVR